MTETPQLVIGVDTGGTFTDVTMIDTTTGKRWTGKTPTTPADPSLGFRDVIAAILRHAPDGAKVVRVLHGTTVATNLILENKTAPVALLTNRGFRYVLEIGRNDVPRGHSLFSWIKPQRPVAPQHIYEIGGRIDPDGREIAPLDEGAVEAAAAAIAAAGIGAVAVVFLHSYANSAHERRAGEILAACLPAAAVSRSVDVLPVFREYERSMTTVLNVAVKPVMDAYVARLEGRLRDLGIAAPLLLMKSNGGAASAAQVRVAPVETALSGPAAGAVGAALAGAAAGLPNVIGVDIGGTSADIGLIREARPELTGRGRIGNWPLGLPVVDIRTIGAGGGSIARVSAGGALTVGPESAGALPGPACYGRGGAEPTVTDAHLVLGHLPPSLLGGSFALDRDLALGAIARRVAEPLGMTVAEAARGILAVVNHHMVGAVRLVSVEQGHDPRDFALLPFGGAGPLHGGELARLLGMRTILIPPSPGVLSAQGLLLSDIKAEFSRTLNFAGGRLDMMALAQRFATLDAQATAWLEAERVPKLAQRTSRSAALRYRNQGFELQVPWTGGADAAGLADAIAAFHAMHERLYSFAQQDTPVEVVTLRVEAAGVFPAPAQPLLPAGGSTKAAIVDTVVMARVEGDVRAPVYDRARLPPEACIPGPAIVSQFDSTTLLLPGQTARVLPDGTMLVSDLRP